MGSGLEDGCNRSLIDFILLQKYTVQQDCFLGGNLNKLPKTFRKQSHLMLKVQSFTLKGLEIDLMYQKGNLAYTFKHNGQTYGIAVKRCDKDPRSNPRIRVRATCP